VGRVAETRRQQARRRQPAARPRARVRSGSASHNQHVDQRLAWYLGLGLMAVFEMIDWPVAIVIAIGHEIAHRARTQALRELAEGIEAAV
jgi:hypothetical protein